MAFQDQIKKLAKNHEIPNFETDPTFGTERSAQEKRAWAQEILARKMEALSLYRPSPFQEAFHACKAKQCILMKGNQAGGSLALFAELARAVTGQDPHGKYPKKNGIAVVLGMAMDHIGLNIHPYLFQSARFNIIRDELTKEWRPFRPWDEADLPRSGEMVPAPPLIPERFIKHISWENRGMNIFSYVEFITGWQLWAMGSQGVPKAGFQADLVTIDEDLERANWYQEMLARLMIRNGKLRWAALPYGTNEAISNMVTQAEGEEQSDTPEVVCVRATIYDNPYLSAKSRDETIKGWKAEGEEVYRMRALGEMRLGSLMYPTFHRDVHCIPRKEGCGTVYDLLMERNGQPPADWCRYAFLDPGHSTFAVLFMAVPPEELGPYVVAYDELYIRDCDAIKFGRQFAARVGDQQFEEFVIDMHGANLRDIGGGERPLQQYERQLEHHDVRSNFSGYSFRPASANEEARQLKLREMLSLREDGTVRLQILSGFCPNLVNEISKLKRKMEKSTGKVLDTKRLHSSDHLTDCLEYASAHGLRYVAPRTRVVKKSSLVEQIMERRALAASKKTNSSFINLGPVGIS